MDKKLKRGLADLSILFSGGTMLPLSPPQKNALVVEAPQEVPFDSPLPRLACTAFVHTPELFQLVDLLALLDRIKLQFEEVFLLSVARSPAKENVNGSHQVRLQKLGERITFGQISSDYFQELHQPEMIPHYPCDFSDSRKALIVFDAIQGENGSNQLLLSPWIFELLDRCVFVVPVDLNQLVVTYRFIQSCFTWNQALQCSLLLVGHGAQALWEFVFERFNSILSEFVGRDLEFLGWMEEGRIQLNPELLLAESDDMMQNFSKAQLCKALFPSSEWNLLPSGNGKKALGRNQECQFRVNGVSSELNTPELIAFSRFGMELRSRSLLLSRTRR